jgi:folylpolyglutamate synthase/dihydropteroate synthase
MVAINENEAAKATAEQRWAEAHYHHLQVAFWRNAARPEAIVVCGSLTFIGRWITSLLFH